MRDWRAYVREHLGLLCFGRVEEEEVVRELAGHLEECYTALREQGIPEEEAFSQTCERAGNWEELQRGIVSARQEGMMSDRVRQVWVPGLVTLLSSYIALAILQWAGTRPLASHPGEPRGIVFYVPWLLILPMIGAVGGYMSRRARGSGWRVYFAASLPALALGAFFLLLFPLALVIDRQVSLETKGTALAASMVGWVILPGLLLSVGVALQSLRKMTDGKNC